ncbi:MAG: hypothetical protein AAB229_08675 [Candidatus Hydrogenedentota bacterium]
MTSPDEHSNEACRAAEPALGALLSGDFTREEFVLANRHLADCSACRAVFGSIHAFPSEFRAAYGIERKAGKPSRRYEFAAVAAVAASILLAFSLIMADRNPVPVSPGPSVPELAQVVAPPARIEEAAREQVVSPAITATIETAAVARRVRTATRRPSSTVQPARQDLLTPIVVQETDLAEMLNDLTDEELLNLIS